MTDITDSEKAFKAIYDSLCAISEPIQEKDEITIFSVLSAKHDDDEKFLNAAVISGTPQDSVRAIVTSMLHDDRIKDLIMVATLTYLRQPQGHIDTIKFLVSLNFPKG